MIKTTCSQKPAHLTETPAKKGVPGCKPFIGEINVNAGSGERSPKGDRLYKMNVNAGQRRPFPQLRPFSRPRTFLRP